MPETRNTIVYAHFPVIEFHHARHDVRISRHGESGRRDHPPLHQRADGEKVIERLLDAPAFQYFVVRLDDIDFRGSTADDIVRRDVFRESVYDLEFSTRPGEAVAGLRDGGRDRRRISGAALQARHIPAPPPETRRDHGAQSEVR